MNISAIILTKNVEATIKRCLDSLKWIPDIVVVDSHSDDKTVDIVKSYTKNKLVDTDWLGYSDTKKVAVSHVANQWVLWIDADEECTPELENSVKDILVNPCEQAYKIRRSSFFIGKQVEYSGWQNDWVIRLFDKNKCRFDGNYVHEKLLVDGKIKPIRGLLNHYTNKDFAHYMQKFGVYTWLGAQRRLGKVNSVGFYHLVIRPKARFIWH